MIVADKETTLAITGNGDIIESHDGIMGGLRARCSCTRNCWRTRKHAVGCRGAGHCPFLPLFSTTAPWVWSHYAGRRRSFCTYCHTKGTVEVAVQQSSGP
jgi:hypothetical protein